MSRVALGARKLEYEAVLFFGSAHELDHGHALDHDKHLRLRRAAARIVWACQACGREAA